MTKLTELTPHQLAELRLEISDEFSKLGQRKVELQRIFAEYYKTFRDDYKSDAGLERSFERTKEGLEMMEIREKMKSKLMKMSAIKTLLEVANAEARNQY